MADGNTWNHEQIATIGYMLTSPVKKAHTLVRHLAVCLFIDFPFDRRKIVTHYLFFLKKIEHYACLMVMF